MTSACCSEYNYQIVNPPQLCLLTFRHQVKCSLLWKLSGSENAGAAAITSEQLMNTCLPELEAGRMELAMTGKAFRVLKNTTMMSDILFFCRIFARVTPEEKVSPLLVYFHLSPFRNHTLPAIYYLFFLGYSNPCINNDK